MSALKDAYSRLLRRFGRQGWWPILSMAGRPGFDERGYHKGDYSYPKTEAQRFEIAVGAILTQNTSWRNVEKAMLNLSRRGILSRSGIIRYQGKVLEECLKPVGYFRVKAKRLLALVEFLEGHGGINGIVSKPADELRALLLDVNGIGDETADSIVLYAAGKPSFVVDAYTRRIMSRMGVIEGDAYYGEIKRLFEENLPVDVELYNEYHALLVELAKVHCRKVPLCEGCPLEDVCEKRF